MMMKHMQYLTGILAIAFAAQVSAQTPVEVKLVKAFEEDRGWCLDVRGAPGRTAPIGGLRSETCKTYVNNMPTEDQAFDMENIHKNDEFRMIEFGDKCITLYKPAAGSFVSLESCDGRAAQVMTLDDAGHIIPEMMPELCLTISDVVLPGGGGLPLHLMRDVTFEECDPAIDDRQSWELRTEWTGPQETTAERPFVANPNAVTSHGQTPQAEAQLRPSQVLYNGKILTVDADFSIAEAIAISGERIVAVGSTNELLAMADENTEQVNLEGRTVIPGFIDNHIHYLRGTYAASYELRIHGMTSRQQVLESISAKAEELGPGQWIFIIGGWRENQFADQPGGFTREELNAAAPENPVYIQRTYGAFYVNQLAADVLYQINPEWFSEDGALRPRPGTGRAVMAAALEYFPSAEDLEGRMEEVKAFNRYLNSMGITTTYDAGYLDGSYEPVEAVYEAGQLSLRVFYALRYWAETARTSIAAAELLDREAPFQRDDRFGMFGIGEHVHGFVHDNTRRADSVASDDHFEQWALIAEAAAKNGWYVNEHAMQDETARRMLDYSEEFSKRYPIKDLRWTLGHVELVRPETIKRAKELGWNISVANNSMKMPVNGIATPPIRAIQDSGILWGLGSDGTIVATYNPFHTIWGYTAGKIFPNIVKFQPDEVITREEALIAHTRSNAHILFMEDKIGTLEAGKYADLVVLDRDYMTVPLDEIRDLNPVMTMVAGEVVYRLD